LKPDGVLAVHITNRFLDLRQVIATGASHFGHQARLIDYDGSGDPLDYRSTWALTSAEPKMFAHPLLAGSQAIEMRPSFKPWRDDYSSLFSILK
jgi:hypothetical protein